MKKFILTYFCNFISQITTFSEEETIPFESLRHDFKKRIANLAPVAEIGAICEVCPEIKQLCRHRQVYYFDELFITDDYDVYGSALKQVPIYNRYKFLYKYLRYFIDGFYYFIAPYNSVLLVDSLFLKGKQIYVEDTLVLYCNSTISYDKVIPSITGPYTRLVLGGSITWNQAKQLIHSKVQKVYIHAYFIIKPNEYDDFADFVVQHSRSFHSCFHVDGNAIPELKTKISERFNNHGTHVVLPERHDTWIVYHKKYALIYLTRWSIVLGVQLVLTCLLGYMTSLYVFVPVALLGCVINLQGICLYLRVGHF